MGMETGMQKIDGRAIAALLNPRPVVLITCCGPDGQANILTVAWQTPLSHQPPMLGISIDLRRYSYDLISQTRQFVVNVVGPEFQSTIAECGSISGREVDKLAACNLQTSPAHCVTPPLLAGALAHLECEVAQVIPTGDHTFFTANVVYAQVDPRCFSDAWSANIGQVLLCLQRDHFATWTEISAGEYGGK